MSWEKNQRKRDRLARQRQRLLNELNYYKRNSFDPNDQGRIDQRIKVLERDLEQQGVPGTYR